MSRRHLSDAAVVMASVGTAAVLSVAYNAIAGRQLGPAAYSDFASGIALATLLAVALGALTPVTAHLSASYAAAGHPGKIRGLLRRLFRWIALIGVATVIIAAAAAMPLADALQFSSPFLVPAAVAVFLGMATGSVIRAALRGAQRFGTYGGNLVAEATLRLLLGVTLLALTGSAVAAVLAYALAMLLVIPHALGVVRRLSDDIEPVERGEVTSLLSPMAFLVGAMALYGSVDLIIVKRLFDPAEAGIYGAAATLARSMVVVIMPLEALLVPRLTFAAARNENLQGLLAVLVKAGSVAFLPLIAFAAAPALIMTLLYGPDFLTAGQFLFPLSASLLAACFAYLAGQVLVSIGKPGAIAVFVLGVVIEVMLLLLLARSLERVVSILVVVRSIVLLFMLIALWSARAHGRATES